MRLLERGSEALAGPEVQGPKVTPAPVAAGQQQPWPPALAGPASHGSTVGRHAAIQPRCLALSQAHAGQRQRPGMEGEASVCQSTPGSRGSCGIQIQRFRARTRTPPPLRARQSLAKSQALWICFPTCRAVVGSTARLPQGLRLRE